MIDYWCFYNFIDLIGGETFSSRETKLCAVGGNKTSVQKTTARNTCKIKNTEKEEFGADRTDGDENEEEKTAILWDLTDIWFSLGMQVSRAEENIKTL